MRTVQVQVAVLALVVLHATMCAATGCEQVQGSQWLVVEKIAGGYSIRFADPAHARKELNWGGSSDRAFAAANQLPPNRASVFFPAEELSQHAAAAPIFIGRPSVRAPLPLDGVWNGGDPLSCLRSFAQAAGLDVVVPKPGFWLVGAPEMLDPAAVEVFAYSIDITLQPLQSEAEVGALEHALLASLPIRDAGPRTFIGIGYHWVPGEPDTLLVMATDGANTNPSDGDDLEVTAYKVRVHREGGRVRVECLWGQQMGLSGQLLPAIEEDFDGDGLQDFYFQEAGDRDRPDVILSGADGSVLAEMYTGSIAVQKAAAGPGAKLFAVDYLWDAPKPEGRAAVCRYSAGSKRLELAPPQAMAQSAGNSAAGAFRRHGEGPVDMLAEALGRPEAVRVYVLPGYQTTGVDGAEYVRVHSSSVWGWFVNRNLKWTMDNPPPDRLAVHILLRYFSPGYLAELEKERARQQR